MSGLGKYSIEIIDAKCYDKDSMKVYSVCGHFVALIDWKFISLSLLIGLSIS